MKICILTPPDKSITANTEAFIANLSRLIPMSEISLAYIKKDSAYRKICRLIANNDFDLFFNFCVTSAYSTKPGIEVARLLEHKNVAFTGADSRFFDPSKLSMKIACHSVGVKSPHFYYIDSDQYHLSDIIEQLKFPMIVKPPEEGDSVGIYRSSLVKDAISLKNRIAKTLAAYGSVLVEEFIEGREFTALVLENPNGKEPIVFKPLECLLRNPMDFKYYKLKWKDYHLMQWAPCDDADLEEKLISATRKVFLALEGNGFARADIRVDREGNVFLLEINPNCTVYGWSQDTYGSADLILNHEKAHAFFTDTLIQLALNRKKKNEKKIKVTSNKNDGFGLTARRDIHAGENLICSTTTNYGDMSDYRLVTRKHVEQHWNNIDKDFFHTYCWPLNKDVFVMWSKNPDEWLPLNHSCNPNAWMSGLDLVARKNINSGEMITIDYVTFCSDEMKTFSCQCGEKNCRGIIHGYQPHIRDFIIRTYGYQVSHYIDALMRSSDYDEGAPTESL